jgi:hypothetical protein
MNDPTPSPARPELEDRAPVLGSWRNIYLVLVGGLALYVMLLWGLSWVYR